MTDAPQRRMRVQAFSRVTRVLGMSLVLLLLAGPVFSEDGEGNIKYRQNLMSAIGYSTGAIGDILKYRLHFISNIQTHANNIAADAKLISSAFQNKFVDGKTDAKANIWSDWEDFEKKIQDLRSAAVSLSEATADGNMEQIQGGLKNLGKACNSCHKQFRKPKEESYKNK